MLLENAASTRALFCKSKWCFIDCVAQFRHSYFKFLKSQNWLWTSETDVFEFVQEMPKHGKRVCATTWIFWLMDYWWQRLGQIQANRTHLVFLWLRQGQTDPPHLNVTWFSHSCHCYDIRVSEICQRLAMLRLTAGGVLARAVVERPSAASQSCVGDLSLAVVCWYVQLKISSWRLLQNLLPIRLT